MNQNTAAHMSGSPVRRAIYPNMGGFFLWLECIGAPASEVRAAAAEEGHTWTTYPCGHVRRSSTSCDRKSRMSPGQVPSSGSPSAAPALVKMPMRVQLRVSRAQTGNGAIQSELGTLGPGETKREVMRFPEKQLIGIEFELFGQVDANRLFQMRPLPDDSGRRRWWDQLLTKSGGEINEKMTSTPVGPAGTIAPLIPGCPRTLLAVLRVEDVVVEMAEAT